MTTTETITVVEHEHVERDYGFRGNIAIIDHEKHGRLLIEDGFGGMDSLEGGAVRWKHGDVYRLHADDTLAKLRETEWCGASLLNAVRHLEDPSRPSLEWWGHAIEALAVEAGL